MIAPVLINSHDENFQKRCSTIGEFLKIESKIIENLDDVDVDKIEPYSCVFLDGRKLNLFTSKGLCQITSQLFPESKAILVVGAKVDKEEVNALYNAGASLIINENDFFNYSKIDFYLNYILKNVWVPVKPGDFVQNTKVNFNIYHYIPYRNKYFPLINGFSNEITEEKYQRIKEVGELYIRRENLADYNKYVSENNYDKVEGVIRRCRAKYLEFYDNYIELSFQLTDEAKHYTFEEGKAILEKTKRLCSELIGVLGTVGDPWLVVNNLTSELEGPLARIPVVAAYVGICSLMLDMPKTDEAMIATLLADLGLFKVSNEIFYKSIGQMSEDNQTVYLNHPVVSLNFVLDRKLPISESIRGIILNSHENILGKGFPKGAKCNRDKVPKEAQLMQICQMLDRKLIIKPGKMRPKINEVKSELMAELRETKQFEVDFVNKLEKELLSLSGGVVPSVKEVLC